MRSLFLHSCAAAALSLAAAGAAGAGYVDPHVTHAAYGHVRVVVPVTSADPGVWSFKLHNLLNGEQAARQWKGALEARVVLYGQGVKLLQQPTGPLKEAIDQLRAAGVQFEICNNTLKGMDLDWHELYGVKEADVVPSGFQEVAWLANQGWAVGAMN
jgi:intracellular sulfur oxidation DsrE/DsrF family protein